MRLRTLKLFLRHKSILNSARFPRNPKIVSGRNPFHSFGSKPGSLSHCSSVKMSAPSCGPITRPEHPVRQLERVKGIEPSSSAWKAVALPLSYTRPGPHHAPVSSACPDGCPSISPTVTRQWWWRELDSNQRRHSQRVYSPSPLATRASLRPKRKTRANRPELR
jgi:hypothetical protein